MQSDLRNRASTNSSNLSDNSVVADDNDAQQKAQTASSLSVPRRMLRNIATKAAQNPIEVIVSIFVIVTLAYFQLVHALATSNFLEPLTREASGLAAASSWGDPSRTQEFQNSTRVSPSQGTIFVRREGTDQWEVASQDSVDILHTEEDTSLAKHFIVEPIFVSDMQKKPASNLQDIAQRLEQSLFESDEQPDRDVVPLFPIKDTQSDLTGYAFGRIQRFSQQHWKSHRILLEKVDNTAFLDTLVNTSKTKASVVNEGLTLAAIFPDSDLQDLLSGGETGQLHSVRWAAYAMWALGLRFWALLKRADSADIFVMLSAYIFMHATFVNLFLSMRKFGSSFWLGASVLTSSICAFLCAMTMAYLVGVTVDPICLSEALPFLVIIVGFEKPYSLTKAVFTNSGIAPQASASSKAHPSLLLSALNDSQQAATKQRNDDALVGVDTEEVSPTRNAHWSQEESFVRALTARLKSEPSLRWSAPQPISAKEVVVAAVDSVGVPIVRDYAIEIAVMAVGATSGLSGLREFCQLAALILIFDCAFLFVFLVATLTIMVEVHRIKVMRGMKRVPPSTPPNVDSDAPPSGVESPFGQESLSRTKAPLDRSANRSSLWRKVVKLIFGKVPFEPQQPGKKENPVTRLKLLLVTTFLTLHSLNLVSTLTTQSAITRHRSTDEPTLFQSIQESSQILKPSATSQLYAPLLDRIASSQPTNTDLYVKIKDPITFVLIHDGSNSSPDSRTTLGNVAWNASGSYASPTDRTSSLVARFSRFDRHGFHLPQTRRASSLNVLDNFMSGWSVIAGDPVISKWLSLALVISIFLNAYLLKGIATGNAAVADGNAAGAAAFAAARMIGAHLDREESSSPRKTFKEDTADERLSQYHRTIAKAAQKQSKATTAENIRITKAVSAPVTAPGHSQDATPQMAPEKDLTPQQVATLSLNGVSSDSSAEPRPLDEILQVYAEGAGVMLLSDEEMIILVQKGKLAGYALEKTLQDNERAVRIRRAVVSRASSTKTLEGSLVPLGGYDYQQVIGACCENVVGYMPLPLGIAGPLMIDGQMLPIPMATSEGTLVASTSRGCKALNAAGGVTTVLTQDAMTRGPAVEFSTISQAAKAKRWIDSPDGASTIKEAFDSTSRFARLSSLRCVMAGRTLYIRFATSTGDAMGMNMVSKGVEKALDCMSQRFDMQVLSLSGNYCIDKKPSAINWIEGRGKSVCCEAIIPAKTVKGVLKASVSDLVNLNVKKNLIGSAMAGSIGGFNAHAANIVAAIFIATGQDPAQVVESSMCMTLMEAIPSPQGGEDDLLVTVSMPSIEVGTVGGGTILSPQRGILEMLGVAGSSKEIPGANAQRLARIIAAAVMAGELSLMGALSAGHLIQAHMKHNRSVPPTPGHMTPTGSLPNGLFNMATSTTPSRSQDPPTRFQASMTPLVAPSVGGSAMGSPDGSSSSTRERRSASTS